MRKHLLTLEDLYNYYSSNTKSSHFSSKTEDKNIVVQVPGQILFEKEDSDSEGLTSVILQACHTLENLNKSFISDEVADKAMNSFKNRPILGRLHKVEGEWEFGSHDMHLDEDGNIEYDEVPVGIIPESSNPHFEYDDEKQHNYVVVKGYIFDEYNHAKDVLERKQECSVSVELSIRELSYNAKEKVLNIEDYFYSGVTILGKTDSGIDVKPGMEGSNIKLADFKADKNSVFSQEDVIARISELEKKFEDLTINKNQGKEDVQLENEITNMEEQTEEVVETVVEEVEPEVVAEETPEVVENESVDEKFTKVFELSHEDVKCSLYELLASFESSDNEWYWISNVYDDYFVYEGAFGGKVYGQKYTLDGDNVSLDGERWSLHKELLTDGEYAKLQEMRSNYDLLLESAEKLAKYEAEPQKLEILNSGDYAQIAETEDFVEFKKQESHFDLSVEEVKTKADEMLLSYAKKGLLDFAKETESKIKVTMTPMDDKSVKNSRYGNLFGKN